jgi:hypothetical protein
MVRSRLRHDIAALPNGSELPVLADLGQGAAGKTILEFAEHGGRVRLQPLGAPASGFPAFYMRVSRLSLQIGTSGRRGASLV